MAAAQPAAPPEAAPQLPAVLTLQQAQELFRERGFDRLVAEANVMFTQGTLAAAGMVPNPFLTFGAGKNFQCAQSQDCKVVSYSVGLSDSNALSNFFTGKWALRREVASAALEAIRRSRDDALRTLGFALKQAYVQVLLARAQREVARETQQSTLRTRQLNERRFALGAINEADLALTQVAELEAEQALDTAEQGLRTAKVALAFLLGFRELVPEFDVDAHELDFSLPGPLAQATRESLLREGLARRPDLRAQMQQEKRADAALSLARRNRVPDFTLGATYTANGSGDTNISPPNATISLTFAPPIFYRQRGEITQAEADLATQQILRQKVEAQVVSDLETAFAQLNAARKLVERMNGTLLERAQKARDLVQVQYEKGAASLLDLLNAQRTYTATRGEYAQDLASYWNAVGLLEQAVAEELRG
jgi:cobalt-zinc-cadmium efflux system outer membrane protein